MATKNVSIRECAARIGVGRTSVYSLLASGQLPSFHFGRRRLIREADLDAFIRSMNRYAEDGKSSREDRA